MPCCVLCVTQLAGPLFVPLQPRWDQGTFEGRARHFFTTTNPMNVLATDEELDRAKELVEAYK